MLISDAIIQIYASEIIVIK